jgi:hypothetical protein
VGVQQTDFAGGGHRLIVRFLGRGTICRLKIPALA